MRKVYPGFSPLLYSLYGVELAAMINFFVKAQGVSISLLLWVVVFTGFITMRYWMSIATINFQKQWFARMWRFELFKLPIYVLYVICKAYEANGVDICHESWFVVSMLVSQLIALFAILFFMEWFHLSTHEDQIE